MSTAAAASLQGWLTMAGLIVALGAQNVFVLRQGLAREHVGAVVAFCIASDVALTIAGVFGLGAWIGRSPLALDAMRWGGAAFLAVCAWRAGRRAWRGDSWPIATPHAGATLAGAAAVTWLNPHVWLDTVVLLGALGAQQPAPLRPPFALGAALASAMWFSLIGFGAASVAPWLARPRSRRAIDAAVALVMAALAVQLLTLGVLQ